MAQQNNNFDNVLQIAKIGLIFIIGKKALEVLNVIDTKEEKEQAAAAAALQTGTEAPTSSGTTLITELPNNPSLSLNPNYFIVIYKFYKLKYPSKDFNNAKQASIPTSTLQTLARGIYEAKGKFNDDEDSLYTSFKLCETQYQVSLMSFYFTYFYKTDMFTYIKGFTNTAERAEIYNIIKNYPQVYKFW